MRLAYLVPAPISLSMGTDEVERRRAVLRGLAGPGTTLDLVEAAEGPASIESALEEYLSVPGAAREVERLEAEGYDGAVLGCAGDPGLDALREVAERLVIVGPGEASFLMASTLGRRFAVLTPAESTVGPTYDQVHRSGLRDRLAGVRSVEIPVLAMRDDRRATLARVEQAARRALDEDGADVLVLGCMSLAFLRADVELAEATGVPVVNPLLAAVKFLEALVSAGLHHSKRAFPRPPKLAHGAGVASLLLRTGA
ncbi:aspartate/glutamate racemase family protein [Limnochorda pilosa]|uniref:Asp/Glu racemase n=1 Tax=Limnochorda pilosa TaxID=1555112 RepID=A0A0K2SLL7_LIMPI|nr:AroM family protein [Limnochorda pilosa]BAS28000.1 Asp/Glu racemase [Limnochorda pilosa]